MDAKMETGNAGNSTGQNTTPTAITSLSDPLAAPIGGTVVKTSHTQYDPNSPPPGNTIGPGVHCGGLTPGNNNGVTYKLTAGTYVKAGGGFTLNNLGIGDAPVGVTIYNTSTAGYACSTNYAFAPVTITGASQFAITLRLGRDWRHRLLPGPRSRGQFHTEPD
jgi:hypothetical protein